MNSCRYPRTMQEAFGPYTDRMLYEPPTQPGWATAHALIASIGGMVLMAVVFGLLG
jgi:hypothetical protein